VLDPIGQADPRVHAVLPHRDARRGEVRVGERADRHRDVLRPDRQWTVAPQRGQKKSERSSPSSEIRTYSVASSSIRTRSRGQRACVPNTVTVRLWQARQWQIDALTGWPSTSTVSCPHEQDARRVAMAGRFRAAEAPPRRASFRPGTHWFSNPCLPSYSGRSRRGWA